MSDSDGFEFAGFSSPNYTQVPDEVFDQLLPVLKEAEIKVLLYIIRRTFGFKKSSDDISFNQFLKGITTREGRQLDQGCGVRSSSTLNAALKSLEARGIIVSRKLVDHKGAFKTTTYAPRFRQLSAAESAAPYCGNRSTPSAGTAVPSCGDRSSPTAPAAATRNSRTTTAQQETDLSNDSNSLNGFMSKDDAERIAWVISDIAREFTDQAPAKSSAARACNLFLRSGLRLDDFLDTIQLARTRTQRYTGNIKTERLENGAKPKMAYFFGVLEDLAVIGSKR